MATRTRPRPPAKKGPTRKKSAARKPAKKKQPGLTARSVDVLARGGPFAYYEIWLATFEELLGKRGLVTAEELDESAYQFEFGERDEVF